jgi:hypothetical protein
VCPDAALLGIVAIIFNSSGKKTPGRQTTSDSQPPQPMIQDNNDNNVQDLKNQRMKIEIRRHVVFEGLASCETPPSDGVAVSAHQFDACFRRRRRGTDPAPDRIPDR